MADQSIRSEFVEGVMEVYTTLMNDGSEQTDGVFLYLQSEDFHLYHESKVKHYKPPVLLVCKAILEPTHGEQDVKGVRNKASFTVPYKSLVDNDISVSHSGLDILRRAIMNFHDVWYLIDNVSPQTYVEDVFLVYRFDCTEFEVFEGEGIVIDTPEEEEPAEPDLEDSGGEDEGPNG